eukprot:1161662-Pelagomonas_calceolata.AAC.3
MAYAVFVLFCKERSGREQDRTAKEGLQGVGLQPLRRKEKRQNKTEEETGAERILYIYIEREREARQGQVYVAAPASDRRWAWPVRLPTRLSAHPASAQCSAGLAYQMPGGFVASPKPGTDTMHKASVYSTPPPSIA